MANPVINTNVSVKGKVLMGCCSKGAWVILDMGSANERRRYIVTLSFIGWAHTQNGPWGDDKGVRVTLVLHCIADSQPYSLSLFHSTSPRSLFCFYSMVTLHSSNYLNQWWPRYKKFGLNIFVSLQLSSSYTTVIPYCWIYDILLCYSTIMVKNISQVSTVTSYGYHSVSIHRQLKCLLNSFRQTPKNIKAPRYWPCFPSQGKTYQCHDVIILLVFQAVSTAPVTTQTTKYSTGTGRTARRFRLKNRHI